MNPDHLHLFTPVEKGLPEENTQASIILNNHIEWIGRYSLKDGWKILDDGGEGWIPESVYVRNGERVIETMVTHWQDKNSLTTKQRSVKLAEEAYQKGIIDQFNFNASNGIINQTFQDFIKEKQKEL